ncbi:MAG: O-methyltransferase [Planctomycetota bacterium]|nr:MAG: O-methyltransferase [Planctomycetota bacterium]
MSNPRHAEVDRFFLDALPAPDEALDAALADSATAGLPEIQVTPAQGRALGLLARAIGAARILEIGTLGGVSAIHMARALPPDGRLVTLELEPRHAAVARRNLDRARLADRVEIVVGPALDSMDRLIEQGAPPFDLVFIDADKENLDGYFARALRLTRPGGVILADNVVRDGAVVDDASGDPRVLGVRRMLGLIRDTPNVSATVIQTVGAKGYDGFLLAVVDG